MTATWPYQLKQFVLVSGFEETAPNTVIATPMECGAPKRRQRFTAAVRPIKGSLTMSVTDRATLDAFYTTTLGGGALTFSWVHPITQAAATFAFVSPPKYTTTDGVTFQAMLDLEIRP